MYSSFEKYLDSIDKLDKKAYENIKSKFGEDTDLYFEEYVLYKEYFNFNNNLFF